MGDLPTTRAISILRYGEAGPPEPSASTCSSITIRSTCCATSRSSTRRGRTRSSGWRRRSPADFVPRADLVLFVTSLLQPLTASELDFLAHIREWGKKVVFVVNGVDRRNSDEQLDRVREYLTREVTARLGGPPPTIYFISALGRCARRCAAQRRSASRASAAPRRPIRATSFRRSSATCSRRCARRSACGSSCSRRSASCATCSTANLAALETRLDVVHEDARVLRSMREQLEAYTQEMRTDSERYLLGVQNVLYELERRGRDVVRADDPHRQHRTSCATRTRSRTASGTRSSPTRRSEIEDVVHRMVDWTVRATSSCGRRCSPSSMRTPRGCAPQARWRRTATPSSTTTARSCSRGCASRSSAGSASSTPRRRRARSWTRCKEAVAQAFGVNVLALGLGAVLVAVFTTAALDVTGVLTATLFAVAGWLIIPARRRQLIRELEDEDREAERRSLGASVAKFEEQLARYERQLLEVIAALRAIPGDRAREARARPRGVPPLGAGGRGAGASGRRDVSGRVLDAQGAGALAALVLAATWRPLRTPTSSFATRASGPANRARPRRRSLFAATASSPSAPTLTPSAIARRAHA